MTETKCINPTPQGGDWPNMLIFPMQLRDMIPDCGPRALVVGEVSGAPNYGLDSGYGAKATRAVVQFVVHETGKLEGKVPVYLDADGPTLQAIGQFLLDLAQQVDSPAG